MSDFFIECIDSRCSAHQGIKEIGFIKDKSIRIVISDIFLECIESGSEDGTMCFEEFSIDMSTVVCCMDFLKNIGLIDYQHASPSIRFCTFGGDSRIQVSGMVNFNAENLFECLGNPHKGLIAGVRNVRLD